MHESSEEFEFRPDWTTDCGVSALERLKNPYRLIMGKTMSAFLDRILFILAGIDNIDESLDEFEIRPDPTTCFHGNRQGYDGTTDWS